MKIPKTINDLMQLITDEVEENINLDYKAADALQNTDSKKKEIAKDVSAMANSAGGIIIYGIKEFDEPDNSHLPESITPVQRSEFSKEWLENVINSNISPKIDVFIHPISLEKEDEVVYVVEIPQSKTAHQNTRDFRYYRRHNFLSEPMLDYEIRDIYNRSQHPVIELELEIERHTYEKRRSMIPSRPEYIYEEGGKIVLKPREKEYQTDVTLYVTPRNKGNVFANYINFFIQIPEDILDTKYMSNLETDFDGRVKLYGDNTHRDVVDYQSDPLGAGFPKYGPSRFDPVLPGLRGPAASFSLLEDPELNHREIEWAVHTDNAPPQSGSILLNEIPVTIKREEDE